MLFLICFRKNKKIFYISIFILVCIILTIFGFIYYLANCVQVCLEHTNFIQNLKNGNNMLDTKFNFQNNSVFDLSISDISIEYKNNVESEDVYIFNEQNNKKLFIEIKIPSKATLEKRIQFIIERTIDKNELKRSKIIVAIKKWKKTVLKISIPLEEIPI
ncbi:hypothetical protein CWI38_0184p0020 [Hamiltosporidium tvaerminnensis]|uniref:Uncharacterized protein n=1 Tax=Hamiltosporidium tvaerminnensis TaxID=1176355 RepID=A0A4V2JXS6_9MICR|nr:hypothetical protein CWI38_0572p0020 [Hamiltosporidium tvaerminnensis]TBU19860.1 hypothetical protein CWI38_0184p0020 [Hamiltosporidium tvaerminnensis]